MALTPAQKKSMAVGFGLILAAALMIVLIWAGMFLPGLAGEIFRKIAGIMTSPILIDLTLFSFGIMLILCLNAFIRAREGDEFVYLEQVEGPDIPADLPGEARAAIFREAPEPQGLAPTLAAIEGALELEDHGEAAELLFKLPPDHLADPEVLALRIRLARARGQDEQAATLQEQLDATPPRRPSDPKSGRSGER